ncbi:MAG: glycosyltransferase family 4 protein [Candidatus Omnitrophica bacterium]|nr:glycosyltransferase family 4 protein [Candidatus Omnitrophota bacterium]
MKILQVNKFLYPKGGDAVSMLATGELLRQKGHRVLFWGMADARNQPQEYPETFVPLVDLNAAGGVMESLKVGARLLYSFDAKHRIQDLVQRERPDLVHLHNIAHQISPSILDVLKKHKIPCVMTMHDYKVVCGSYTLLSHGRICELCANGKYYHCLLEGCVKGSRAKSFLTMVEMYLHHNILDIYGTVSCFISPSRFLKDKIVSMGFKKRVKHLSNFADLDRFSPDHHVAGRSVVYAGRLSKEKGLMTLVDAAAQIPEIDFKIIGEGPLKRELEIRVKGLKTGNVQLLGHMPAEELRKEVGKSMCVVLPSECNENHPRVVVEAFALGKPVVGSRIGGIPEAVKDGETGLTFCPGDAEDLAEKLRYATDDAGRLKKWGRSARNFAEAEYSADKHYAGLMAIYDEALSDAAG